MKVSKFLKSKGSEFVPGDFNVIDDITGFKVKSSKTSRQWDGLRTTKARPRHSQDSLRGTPERIRTPWARPLPEYVFVETYTGTPLWQAKAVYAVDDVVTWNGVEYTCTVAHTSAYPFDITKWSSSSASVTYFLSRGGDLNGVTSGRRGVMAAVLQLGYDDYFADDVFGSFNVFFAVRSGDDGFFGLSLSFVGNKLLFIAAEDAYTSRLIATSINEFNSASGELNILVSWDADATVQIYINDVDDADVLYTNPGDIDYSPGEVQIGTFIYQDGIYNGTIKRLLVDLSDNVDLDLEANRRLFFDANEAATSWGADGSTPLGRVPSVYLYGETSIDPTNLGTGGGFTRVTQADLRE